MGNRIRMFRAAAVLMTVAALAGCYPRQVVCRCECDGVAKNKPQTVEETPESKKPLSVPDIFKGGAESAPPPADAGPEEGDVVAQGPCGGEIAFRDSGMELVVRRNLQKPRGPITALDAAGLTAITNEDKSGRITAVSDISGIECFGALLSVRLLNSRLKDLTPLAGLGNLATLELSGAGIRDVKALSSLSQLEHLALDGNEISDVTPLVDLRNLQSLSLSRNKITDASALGRMNWLKTLRLAANRIRDVRFVKSLEQLRELCLAENGLTDVGALADSLPVIEILELSGNKIRDLFPLSTTSAKQKPLQLDLMNNGIDCVKQKSDLETISILWSEVEIECPEFNTAP